MKLKKIGFIGIGNMGFHMAYHLIKKKYDVYPYDKINKNLEIFQNKYLKKNKNFLTSIKELDCIILMVPSSREVNDIIFKQLKLYKIMKKGSIIIDMSTSIPTETVKIGNKLNKFHIKFLDCPVAGGVKFAKTAGLTLFLGSRSINKNLKQLLNVFGKIIWCGNLGSGHSIKALNNFINASTLNTYLEAITTALKFGIPKKNLISAIDSATTGKNNPYLKKIKLGILKNKLNSGFTINLLAKDVNIARNLINKFTKKPLVSSNILKILNASKYKLGKNSDQLNLYKMWSSKI